MYERAIVKNFRGASRAEIPFEGVQIIAAPNGAGKTSIAQAVGAALSGAIMPVDGITKTGSSILVKRGATHANVRLEGRAGYSEISWPEPELVSQGPRPDCSKTAAGLENAYEMTPKERAKFFTKLLNAEPTKGMFMLECKDAKIITNDAEVFWKDILELNWDGALSKHKDTGAKLKGQWEAVTGEDWGAKKALTWEPKNLSSTPLEELQKSCDALKTRYQKAVNDAALFDVNLDELEKKSKEADKHLKEMESLREELEKAKAEIKDAQQKQDAVKRITSLRTKYECPGCKIHVVVKDGKLVKATASDGDTLELQKAMKENDEWSKIIEVLQQQAIKIQSEIAEQNALANAGLKARDQLEKIKSKEKVETRPDCDSIAKELNEIQLAIKAREDKTKADNLAKQITEKIALVKMLQPEGLRQRAMALALTEFRKELASLCVIANSRPDAKWDVVALTDDLQIEVGGAPWSLLCKSERFKALVTLQMAIAIRDKSRALLIDEADLLDDGGRNGLMAMVRSVGLPTLIFMTCPKDKAEKYALKIPTHWIQGGEATLLKGKASA